MKTFPITTTVTAFIFHQNKVLLIKHKKIGTWLHVGGHVEENETLDEAVRREVKEEVNLDVKFIEEFGYLKNLNISNGFKELPKPFYVHVRNSNENNHRKMSFDFVCVADKIKTLKIQKNEIDGFQWYSKSELKKSKELYEPVKILALKAFKVYDLWKSKHTF